MQQPEPRLRLVINDDFRLGELLVAHRALTQAQLERAIKAQEDSGSTLKEVLMNLGLVNETSLLRALAAHTGIRPWYLEQDEPQEEAVKKVSETLCRTHCLLPVKLRGDLLIVAMAHPDDMAAIEAVRSATGLRVEPVLADEHRLQAAIAKAFGGTPVEGLVQEAMMDAPESFARREKAVLSEADTRPVVGLVNQILTEAIKAGASDVHIEPRSNRVEVRFRVDGQLHKARELPLGLHQMLLTRLKIMSDLDIVEWRVPQDGRVSVSIDGRDVDLRISVLPNYHGQRVVMRILDSGLSLLRLDELGFSQSNLSLFRNMIHKPHGLVLVTGPTGSGKTTSLYAALMELKHIATNVMTCEDPVEYDIDGINQSQVNEKVGLTFPAQLRAILRQDPDVILVGEIRDRETAETAIRAALTGHLVLSTLHCNDAASAVPRLLDMGVDPYLLSTSLVGVVAQRLLRKLCVHCRRESNVSAIEELLMRSIDTHVFTEVGCSRCGQTGFKGRFAVHEVLPVTGEVAALIASRAPMETLQRTASAFGYRTLTKDALDRVIAGDTSLREAHRHVHFEFGGMLDIEAA
jgi:type IV pilus assembly protein PilB